MSIKITIANKVGFTVKGTINDADGKEQPFDFTLTAARLGEDELSAAQQKLVEDAGQTGNHKAIAEKLVELVTNWTGVRDDTDAPLAYSAEHFAQLLAAYRGLGLIIWRTYLTESGAREKN